MTTDWVSKFPALTVKITYPTGWMHVRCQKFFLECTKEDAEKLFKLLRRFQFEYENRDRIFELHAWLIQAEITAQAIWHEASQEYVNGWRLTDGLRKRSEQYKKIKQNNDRLTDQVKKAKKLSIRMQERRILFESYFDDTIT